LAGVITGDAVSVSGAASGVFADKNVAENKPVSVGGLTLAGAAAANYNLNLTTLSANITPASLTVTGLTANDKLYDGTTSATLSGTPTLLGVIGSDVVLLSGTATASFSDSNPGNNKLVTITGFFLTGSGTANYNLIPPTAQASIISSGLKISSPALTGGVFKITIATVNGVNYTLESKGALGDAAWSQGQTILGDGSVKQMSDSTATSSRRFYRIRMHSP
jgi:hypothetical protein